MSSAQALVVRHGSLGDLVLTVPVIQTLTKQGFQVTMAVRESWGKLLLATGCGFSLLPLDSQFFLPFFQDFPLENHSQREILSSFDLILSFTDPAERFSENLKAYSRVKPVFHPVFASSVSLHLTDYLLQPLKKLFGQVEDKPDLSLPGQTYQYLVIHPGSGSSRKNWPEENFCSLTKKIPSDIPFQILLGPAEEKKKSFWEKVFPARKVIFSATWQQLLQALKTTRVFLGNDSGVTHLAAATGIKTIAIFGPTDPKIWAPRGKYVCLFSGRTDCSPCLPAGPEPSCNKECLRKITVSSVVSEIERMWRSPI